ncbi:hypothetical protein DIPPA_26291 [Diplonema papillatum]|nr:hypothetical protein DIPPA_26291 [Diplonema papillatum]|eukprot:gene10457-16100_t
MACCILPFSGDPVEGEPLRPNQWRVPLKEAACKDPISCCFGFFCSECAACALRKKVLSARNEWPQGYKCCQGTVGPMCCFKPGEMGEADNAMACLCLEGFFCTGCSTSASYIYTMQAYQLENDPYYNKFVRFSNAMQMLACLCSLAAMFIQDLRDAAQCIRLIADFVFRTLMGCINAQVNHEIDYQLSAGGGQYQQLDIGKGDYPPQATMAP